MSEAFNFFYEETEFLLEAEQEVQLADWLSAVLAEYQKQADEINFIFCSDEYLLEINKTYLAHDYYTDVITFDNTEEGEPLQSDIFISIDRVKENAEKFAVTFQHELYRVMVHGILHLAGFKDKTEDEQKLMREKENLYLSEIMAKK
jgi:rRNA maturation RNase YbeY